MTALRPRDERLEFNKLLYGQIGDSIQSKMSAIPADNSGFCWVKPAQNRLIGEK